MVRGKVMIVDDDREFLEEFKETLDLSGYEVIGVNDSTTVKKKAGVILPDVILLDLKMNDMSGFEVAEELRSFSNTTAIPIIAMTGFYKEDEHIALMDICGIKEYIAKPFDPNDAITAIEAVIKRKSA